jgi:hypothetical protein
MLLGAYLQRTRERIGKGGLGGGKRRKVRGFLAKPPFPSPSSVQNREGGRKRLWGGRPAAIAGEPGHRSGQAVGEDEEGDEGD